MYEAVSWKMWESSCLTDKSLPNLVKIILLLAKVITHLYKAIDENTHLELQTRLDLANGCISLETIMPWKPHRHFLRELVLFNQLLLSVTVRSWKSDTAIKMVVHFTHSFQLLNLHTYSSTIWNWVLFLLLGTQKVWILWKNYSDHFIISFEINF